MSLAAVCVWTLARTIVLCLLGCPVIVGIELWLRNRPETARPFAFAVILAPFLFPELLVGYTFRDVALTSPFRAETLCATLLFIRIVPIGVVALIASPSSLMSHAAIHCRLVMLRANRRSLSEWWQLALCYWHGPIRRVLPALGLMSLVAFQEFELAALLQTASWTDWFIAAQRVGLDRDEMFQQAIWPLGMQLPLLAGAIYWFSKKDSFQPEPIETVSSAISHANRYAVIAYLGFALTLGCLCPLARMAWNLSSGMRLLVRQPSQWMGLASEMLVAIAISLCAGVTTWFVGAAIFRHRKGGRLPFALRQALIAPGLIGSLLLSLIVERLFQQPLFRPLYDTPIPWVITLMVWTLPRAVLLQLWLETTTRSEGVYLAELLDRDTGVEGQNSATKSESISHTSTEIGKPLRTIRPTALLFRLRDQPRLMAIGLLCYWDYLDLSTAYLLAPSGMPSGLVRLYNFMHFGRSAALSAESLLYFGIPLGATVLVISLLRYKSQP